MYEYANLSVSRPRPGILLVRLERPEKLNALTFDMFDQLVDLCRTVADDPTVRVVVITGSGRAFCAGLDLEAVASLLTMSALEFLRGQEKWAAASIALHRLATPVIAAVNGPAAGAGMSLALACDIRVANESATFNAAFIRVGLTGGDMGSSWLLPRIVGLGLANEILLTGRPVGAEEALNIGLVNRVFPHDLLLDGAYDIADNIARNSPFGVRTTTQAISANMGAASLELGIELENRNQALARSTDDMREALSAFLEKRVPSFQGT